MEVGLVVGIYQPNPASKCEVLTQVDVALEKGKVRIKWMYALQIHEC